MIPQAELTAEDVRRLALEVMDRHVKLAVSGYIQLTWTEGKVSAIRDYRFARYVMRDCKEVISG